LWKKDRRNQKVRTFRGDCVEVALQTKEMTQFASNAIRKTNPKKKKKKNRGAVRAAKAENQRRSVKQRNTNRKDEHVCKAKKKWIS